MPREPRPVPAAAHVGGVCLCVWSDLVVLYWHCVIFIQILKAVLLHNDIPDLQAKTKGMESIKRQAFATSALSNRLFHFQMAALFNCSFSVTMKNNPEPFKQRPGSNEQLSVLQNSSELTANLRCSLRLHLLIFRKRDLKKP